MAMYEKMNEKYKDNVGKVAKAVEMEMVTESDGDRSQMIH